MKVGVVGLGSMGFGIAKNLVNKDYEVYGFDVNSARMKLLEEIGGYQVSNCEELGNKVQTVIMMVFSPDNLRDALLGKNGLIKTLQPGSTVIVTASVGPEVVYELTPILQEKGVSILDTPLMADVNDAAAGTMHMLVAGSKKLVTQYRSLLDDMSSEIYFVGDVAGKGQAGKMCLQTLFSLTFEQAFEVITLTKKLNLNMEEMHRLFKNSPSSSVLFHITESNVMDRVFTNTNNPLSILDKDIHLALGMADRLSISLPSTEGAAKVFREAMEAYAKEDIWAAVKVVEAEN